MGYVVRRYRGGYYQQRGASDWGWADEANATVFASRQEAQAVADRLTHFGAAVEESFSALYVWTSPRFH
jgi:hypothetical protein